MDIEVQFFSRLRDVTRTPDVRVDLPDGASMGDLLAILFAKYPGLQKWDAHLLLAIGLDFAQRSPELHAGDVVSIMPPVQGG